MKKTFEQLVMEDINPYSSGVYISVDVYHDSDTLQQIQHQVRELFDVPIDLYGLHCTIIYSKKPAKNISNTFLKIDQTKFFDAYVKEITTWVDNKNITYFGILLDSPELKKENERLMKYGFVSDYDEYMPHITLQYDTKIDNIAMKEQFDKINAIFQNNKKYVLQLTNEHEEPLNSDWS